MTPGVFIRHNKSINENSQEEFSVLFLTFSNCGFSKQLIALDSFTQVLEYGFLKQNEFLYKAIDVYFSNKGKKLYILNFPIEDENYFNILEFDNFISRNCDNLVDLEIMLALDLYDPKIYKNILSQRTIVSIQRSINKYCETNSRLSISDICEDFEEQYFDMLGETLIYYPWIKDKTSTLLPPSVYAAALFSKYAHENKFATSIANKEILNAVDIQRDLSDYEKQDLISHRVNPVVFIPHQGVRIWGTKTFDSNVDTTNELRVYKYIKRNLYQIAKVYIFEPNNKNLESRVLMEVRGFLFDLWDKGFLAGSSSDEAYSVTTDIDDINKRENILSIKVAVALIKPLEFILIELNKVAQDGTQSTLSIQ
ncbi:MAG: phage tail sheath subtilisin-like domain-containing protein [Campylobacterota bacterium]|nr:phage tail sheath subtilisin-like domain-containing protein [Campylobacterota bacterium]